VVFILFLFSEEKDNTPNSLWNRMSLERESSVSNV